MPPYTTQKPLTRYAALLSAWVVACAFDAHGADVSVRVRTGSLFAVGTFVCGCRGGVQAAQGVGLDLGGRARVLQMNNSSGNVAHVTVYTELFG